MQLTTDE